MNNVLIIATTSYAGMGPYVSGIVNNFKEQDDIYFEFHDSEDEFYRKNIKSGLLGKSRFFKKADSHWNKLMDLLTPHPSHVTLLRLLNYCKQKDIHIVHWMNGPGNKYVNRFLRENGISVLSTVHDLHPHEAKTALHKMWRFHVLNNRNREAIEEADYMVTNSRVQYNELKEKYPQRKIFFHEFPSLVSPVLASGNIVPKELKGISRPYILFFGRIEEYKGISLLYKAFTECSLTTKYNLVIAGSGTIAFSRSEKDHVIFINRYIKDEEVKFLYENASCVVYPYISATQSGVLSLAYYFGTPVLASDVDYFKSIIEGSGAGQLFEKGDIKDLKSKLQNILLSQDRNELIAKEKAYYNKFYDGEAIRKELLTIYEDIADSNTKK